MLVALFLGSSSPSKITWFSVTSRIVASIVGGYLLAYSCTGFLSAVLPLSKSEAVLSASMMSFMIYTGAILTAFAVATPVRAWLVLMIPAALFAAIAFFAM